jgi:hypothetical protein
LLQRIFACAVAAAVCAWTCGRASADEPPRPIDDKPITVSASRVAYYSDLATVTAQGDVTAVLQDGTSVSGDAFVMDLRLHRLVVAGHVRLRSSAGEYDGAAFADFLAFGRVYFVPLDPSADRWTFIDGDYANPQKGRQMPGDAFFLTDVSGKHPYVVGRLAVIDPKAYVSFQPAAVNVLGLIGTPPLPDFVDNFSANPNFGQNSLPGATVDAPYNFYGTPHSLEAIHFRYDQSLQTKTYGAFEHHSVFGDTGYAVFSVVPATQPQKQWNLLAYDQNDSRSAVSLNAQLFTTQNGLASPSIANGYADVQFVRALKQSSLKLDLTQAYQSLLSAGPPNHPFIAGISWSSDGQQIGRSDITYRLESGLAEVHDRFGVSGTDRTDVAIQHAGVIVATPVYQGPWDVGLSATYLARRTWLDFPNTVDTTSFTVSGAKRLTSRLYTTASFSAGTLAAQSALNVIVSPNVATGLVPQPLSPNGLPVFGVPTISRQITSRVYALTTSWQPSPDFQFATTMQKTVYSPQQLPAPYQLTANVRARLTKSTFVSLGRTYFFNFEGQRWSPQFVLQVTGQ